MKTSSEKNIINNIVLFVILGSIFIYGRCGDANTTLRSFTGGVNIIMGDDFEHRISSVKYYFLTGNTTYHLRIPDKQDEHLILEYKRSEMWDKSHAKLLNVQGYLIDDTLVVKSVRVVEK